MTPPHDKQEALRLFDEAIASVGNETDLNFELSVPPILEGKPKEHARALFILAQESLEDPASLSKYVESVGVSETRKVEAKDLEKKLTRAAQSLEAPKFSLKGGAGTGKKFQPPPVQKSLPPPAPRNIRLKAGERDAVVILLLSVFGAIGVSALEHNSFWARLAAFTPNALLSVELIAPLSYFIALLSLLTLAYPLCALLFTKSTSGLSFYGLTIIANEYEETSTFQLILRVCVTPFAVIIGKALPKEKGDKGIALQDIAAGTTVVKLSSLK